MNIALAASEAVPFCKTGGLADVVGSLARVFSQQPGCKVVLFLPLHRAVNATPFSLKGVPGQYWAPVGEGLERVRLSQTDWGAVRVYFVDQPKYFDRDELYGTPAGDYPDNDERFIFFCRAVLEGLKFVDFKPDVLHCHDWQTALLPAYRRTVYEFDAFYSRCATILTLHNLAYQGMFPKETLFTAGFAWADFTPDKLEYYGGFNFLKAGLVNADYLTTVSPNYARQIQQSEEFGRGLEGVLKHRSDQLLGILNGLDLEEWNPETDSQIRARYGQEGFSRGKAECKRALQAEGGLEAAPDIPLIGIVSRLDPQKGLDVALEVLDRLLASRIQLAVVGNGSPTLHEGFSRLAEKYKGKVYFQGIFDEPAAHRIYAASDILLMPSRFEPCGLGQMIAMRYGTVPVVTRTGGLADTVSSFQEDPDRGLGFVAAAAESRQVEEALRAALATYAQGSAWQGLQARGMAVDFSWEKSATAYLRLFEELAKKYAV